jgi:uncharacterized protein
MDADTGLCAGCLRTLDEIASWGSLDEAARSMVWMRLADRRAALARRGSDLVAPADAALRNGGGSR